MSTFPGDPILLHGQVDEKSALALLGWKGTCAVRKTFMESCRIEFLDHNISR